MREGVIEIEKADRCVQDVKIFEERLCMGITR